MPGFARTELLLGSAAMARLRDAHVAVVGLGGVGSYAAEALIRAPVGHLTLIDSDRVEISNLNRQIHATRQTLGQPKAELLAERARAINPDVRVKAVVDRLTDANAASLLCPGLDYVVDAIDEVTAKVALMEACLRQGIPVVTSMGAAQRLDPTAIQVADLASTRGCPLARAVRKQMRRRGLAGRVLAVYSEEPSQRTAVTAVSQDPEGHRDRRPIGTISYLPALFGLHCAAVVIRALLAPPDTAAGNRHSY